MGSNNDIPSSWIVGLLTIVYAILKLVGVLTFSWWWVFSPIWIPILAIIIVFILVAISTRLLLRG